MQISHDVNNFVTWTGDKVQGRERELIRIENSCVKMNNKTKWNCKV